MELVRQWSDPKTIWWREVMRQWPIYLAGLFAMLVTNGTEVLAPKTLQWMIDALLSARQQSAIVSPDSAMEPILSACALFVMVAFVGLLGRVFWRFTLARMTHVAGASMKRGIWDALKSSPLESVQAFTLGDLMNRAIGDVNSARWIYGFTLVLTCDVIFFTTLGAMSMLLIHPGLALACLSTFVLFPPVIVKLAKREYEAHEAAQSELTTLSEYVSQAVRGVRSQRASDAFGVWIQCLSASAARYAKLRFKAQTLSINSFPICSLPTMASYVILFVWGPQLVMAGNLSVGEFAAMASYVYLLQGPIADVGELVAEWQKGFASVNRIAEITSLPEENGKQIQNVSAPTVFDGDTGRQENLTRILSTAAKQGPIIDVTGLRAERGGRILFEKVDIKLLAGDWLGIFGDVGCGKSTLLQTLSGLVPAAGGEIRLLGQRIFPERRRQTLEAGKCVTAYAPERPFVFAGTIRHNLSLSHSYSTTELWRALELVCLADEVRAMPQGMDGLVGEGGVSLSGGQRQRLALARVILRASDLVLLDDPLSAVDGVTEEKIISNLKLVWTSQAVIWSSSKIQTLSCCERVARLTPEGLHFLKDPMLVNAIVESDIPHV